VKQGDCPFRPRDLQASGDTTNHIFYKKYMNILLRTQHKAFWGAFAPQWGRGSIAQQFRPWGLFGTKYVGSGSIGSGKLHNNFTRGHYVNGLELVKSKARVYCTTTTGAVRCTAWGLWFSFHQCRCLAKQTERLIFVGWFHAIAHFAAPFLQWASRSTRQHATMFGPGAPTKKYVLGTFTFAHRSIN
jgi:hypothetical protein